MSADVRDLLWGGYRQLLGTYSEGGVSVDCEKVRIPWFRRALEAGVRASLHLGLDKRFY